MNDRRQHDPHLAEIINTLNKHSESIEKNAEDVKELISEVREIKSITESNKDSLVTHVGEEAKYWLIVEKMKETVDRLEKSLEGLVSIMNDLAGLGRLGSRAGKVGKWFAGIGGFAAMFYFVWDWMVDHIGKN